MIVGIDHIAWATHNAADEITAFERLGYNVRFERSGVPNLDIKKPLMTKWPELHDLVMLDREGSLPIEMIDHGFVNPHRGFIHNGGLITREEFLAELPDPFVHLAVPSVNYEASVRFWSNLGFQKKAETPGYCEMMFTGLADKRKVIVDVVSMEKSRQYKLDDNGFNCLALVSTNAASERKKLDKKGYRVTEIAEPETGGTPLSVFWVTGPSGELVEIVSPARKKKV